MGCSKFRIQPAKVKKACLILPIKVTDAIEPSVTAKLKNIIIHDKISGTARLKVTCTCCNTKHVFSGVPAGVMTLKQIRKSMVAVTPATPNHADGEKESFKKRKRKSGGGDLKSFLNMQKQDEAAASAKKKRAGEGFSLDDFLFSL